MISSLRSNAARLGPSVRVVVTRGLDSLEDLPQLGRHVRGAWQSVTSLGWAMAIVGVLSWILGWWLGWLEFMIVAAACLLLFVVALGFVVRRSSLEVRVVLEPARVTAGEPAAGSIAVSNTALRRSPSLQVSLRVGKTEALFAIPPLAPREAAEEIFIVPTERRGVIPIGPARSVRGDPLGLLQRAAAVSAAHELIVHPHTIGLAPFGSGLLRDLEGLTTKDLSTSDLAFHALREYMPGDDRRFIHWKSTAKAGDLLVRQFLDTRRSTFCVVVDGLASGYGDSAEFETALEVAGSIALRACRDQLSAVIAAADQAATGVIPHVLLDALARAELGRNPSDLASLVSRAVNHGADISVALVVSGSQCSSEELRRAVSRFSPETRVITVRIVPHEKPHVAVGAAGAVLQLATLADLPGFLSNEVAA